MKSLRASAVVVLTLAASFGFGCGSAVLKPMPDGGDGPAGGSSGGSATAGSGGRGGQGGGSTGGATAGTGGSAGGATGGTTGGTAGRGGGAGGSTAGAAGTGGATAGTGGATAGTGGRGGTGGSGACTDACCTNADCGVCELCTAAHVCSPAKNMDDPVAGRCGGTCDTAGACKSKKGQSCTATSGGCITGSTCAPDGYCCNASCGTDATCAGTCASRADGSCTYPAGQCGTAMCSGSNIVARGTCANGACQMPAPATCTGGFVCAANACKTSCAAVADCLSTNYCDAGSCVAKKTPGQVCTATNQCTTGVCGGRCCNTGVACDCPVQSTVNLIQNGGFDMDSQLNGWTIGSGAGTVTWQANDPTSCPYSGSAYINNATGTGDSRTLSQCVGVTRATTYNFGVTMQSSGGNVHCAVDIFPSANCQGVGINQFDDVWLNVPWSVDMATTIDAGNMVSARVYCWAEAGVSLSFDMVYLTPSPGKF